MNAMPVLVIQGTTGPAGVLFSGIIYDAMVKACGTGPSISLRYGGIGDINQTYAAFAADVDRRLGRVPGSLETPAMLVGHSLAVPLILKYLTVHPQDQAILVGGPVQGLEYLRPVNTWIDFSTIFCPPFVRESIHQMFPMLTDLAPDSRFLTEIRSNSASYADRVVVIAATHDWVVPWRASFIPGARMVLLVDTQAEYVRHHRPSNPLLTCIYLPGSGHLEEMTHRVVHDFVADHIAGMQPEAAQPLLRLVSA